MFLLEWTASDLLMILLAGIAMIGAVLWIVPSARIPLKRSYSKKEIRSYDGSIPRYFIAAAAALVIGAVHMIIKNVPGFWQWLWEAGYGGHLFRDLSNSHIIIVGGGTVLLTGLTWYLLPRIANRPLYSNTLASASFWLTLIGVFGFYLSWLILGLVEGSLVRGGMDYMAAKELVGAAHRVPTRLTASVMGLGYWTYVLNVFLTMFAARHVVDKPNGHLLKFVGVSAGALFVGTVQGVIQVLPANADWIHAAGKFGEYVDPISHAHINLVTGMMVSLAALLAYFAPRLGGKPISRQAANRMFWALVPGSLIFYLTFLIGGLVLGNAVNGYGGIHSPALASMFSRRMPLMLALAGSLMLLGFWVYFATLWRNLGWRGWLEKVRLGKPAAFWLISSTLLFVGTIQGLLQAIPATSRLLTTAEEIPNVHAQLNMIGGVLLTLIGTSYVLIPELLGSQVDSSRARKSLVGIAGGISAYYLTTMAVGLSRYRGMLSGLDEVESARALGWIAPAGLTLAAVPLLLGFLEFGRVVFGASHDYRSEMLEQWRGGPARFSGPMPDRIKRIPARYVLGMEAIGGLFGWPGVGWLYAGQALPGIALLMLGPSIAWALMPMLFSPFTNTVLSQWNWHVLLVWLPVSSALSTFFLALRLRAMRKPAGEGQVDELEKLSSSALKSRRRQIPRGLIVGTGFVLTALVSIPVIPLVSGIPEETVTQPVAADLPDRASGAYLQYQDSQTSGRVKLFPWSYPLDEIPEESPAIAPQNLSGFFIQQKGLADPESYHLFHLEDGDSIPMDARVLSFQKQMMLETDHPLEAGNYMLDIPTGGMFAGREYYYFRVDAEAEPLPVVGESSSYSAPDAGAVPSGMSAAKRMALELLPLSAAIFSGLAAATMVRRLREKVRPHEVVWALAFSMFSLAAGIQVVGDLAGWTVVMVRAYYVLGATLVVGWLGLGTWFVLIRGERMRKVGLWLMIFLSGLAAGLVSLASVDQSSLLTESWHALEKPVALTILTIGINSVGTLVLVGGALWSAWMFWRKGIQRERMVGLLLLAWGALTVAAGGSLTRLGHEQYLYLAMSLGVGLMYWGYRRTIAPPAVERSSKSISSLKGSGMVQLTKEMPSS
jgi:heme/copper-type cytochrome/quinol oxidase subunit 1